MAVQLAQFTARAAALAAFACLSACSGTLLANKPVALAPPSQSVAAADQALASAAEQRAALEQQYYETELVCAKKFLVNACLDHAKEIRRAGLAQVRAIEVEAGHYKRLAAVEQRDRELAQAELDEQAKQAARAAEPPKPVAPLVDTPKPKPHAAQDRVADHAAKLQRAAVQEQGGAARRAANALAFAQRVKDSEQRQRDVADKKAAKAAKAAKAIEDEKADKARQENELKERAATH